MTIDYVNYELIMLTLKINLSNDILFNIQLLQGKTYFFIQKNILLLLLYYS